jgi:RNA-binding protein
MLTSKERNSLGSKANGIKPVVMIGKLGLTEAVIAATRAEFAFRELLKTRFVGCKEEKKVLSEALAAACGADLVRITGNVALLYRPNPELKAEEAEKRKPSPKPRLRSRRGSGSRRSK